MITYITAFLDIKRDNWNFFKRTIDEYIEAFTPFIDLFDNQKEHKMIVYIDDSIYDKLLKKIKTNISLIPINLENISNISPLWKRLHQETTIINSEKYKKTFKDRLHFPENSNPMYTLINHAKIDFVCYTIKNLENFYCWVDFGYFQKKEKIPNKLLNEFYFNKDKITYTLLNDINEFDKDIFYTMHNAPEKIGGFFL